MKFIDAQQQATGVLVTYERGDGSRFSYETALPERYGFTTERENPLKRIAARMVQARKELDAILQRPAPETDRDKELYPLQLEKAQRHYDAVRKIYEGYEEGSASLFRSKDVKYLPMPNWVDVVADTELAPLELTKTAFMIILLRDGSLVMANNVERGEEFAGGHIDPGESPCKAAHREAMEETGYWVSHIRAIGYLRMESLGDVPDGWKYPHPVGYQQFFVGRAMWNKPYVDNAECIQPVILTYEQAKATLSPSRFALYELARRTLK